MNWREFFGIHPDLDRVSPGHNRGLVFFYIVAGACFVMLAYGMSHS